MFTKIVSNKIRCLKCKDIIESKSTHDFKWCSCNSIAVDGGVDYCRRVGDLANYEDLSESRPLYLYEAQDILDRWESYGLDTTDVEKYIDSFNRED